MSKTRRLYYEDQYCHSFTAEVIAERPDWVVLDRTAFYPEGGGQPADHGWLAGVAVTDTQVDDAGVIWHRIEQPLALGRTVTGRVDWQRRFDHMQQHSGQHVLSQAFWQLFGAATVGFHLGEQAVTIDIDRPDCTAAELQQAEDLANAVIRSKASVVARFVSQEQLPVEELRKLPKVSEDIRLVAVEGFDICPCGGTHVKDLGEIGLLKLLAWEKRRGNLRVSFVAGKRAYLDYQQKHQTLQHLSGLLSQPIPEVAGGVERLQERNSELEKQLKGLQLQLAEQEAEQLLTTAPLLGQVRLVCQEFSQRELEALKQLANGLASRGQVAVVFGLSGEGYRLVAAVSPELDLHVGNLLKQVVTSHGGKGGGAPQAAQGAVPAAQGSAALQALRQAIVVALTE